MVLLASFKRNLRFIFFDSKKSGYEMSIKLDQRFKPDLAFKKLQYFQFFIAIIIILISGFMILTLISPPLAIVGLLQ